METQKPLLKDEDGEEVDVYMYRSMIGSLMYLTSSRPDIMFTVYACARYQVNPKVSHLHAVKIIFRYLKGQPKLGLWYPKDSRFDLVAYTDSDYARASLDRKSTTGAATTASSFEAEQDNGNIDKTQSKATLNEPSSSGTSSGSGPRCQETIADTIAQTRFENVSKLSSDPLLARDEEDLGKDASKQGRITDIDVDAGITLVSTHFDSNTDMFGVHGLVGDEVVVESEVAVKAGEKRNVVEEVVDVIDAASTIPVTAATIIDVEITLAQALAELKSAKPKDDKVEIQEPEQGITTTTPITIIPVPKPPQDKGKGIMIEEPVVEHVKPMKRLEQIRLDEELAFKLQDEEEEEESFVREKAQQIEEANITWDDVQAKVKADYQLAQRLQAQEQEELTDEEKARLFVQFLKQRRKHFAAKRAEEKRNRPPTRAQQRNIMCTYLKNMEGWKPKRLKNKSFANIQELFEKAMKRVNTFVDYRTELVEESSKKAETELEENLKKAEAEVMEGSSKRAREELEQESIKKQKVDEDKETTELQSLIEVIPDEEEVAIDVVPLATKHPTIVDWKIYKEGKKSYY
ncbi:hypothetical protein Tco_1228586 [Tanacetum coccineum]